MATTPESPSARIQSLVMGQSRRQRRLSHRITGRR